MSRLYTYKVYIRMIWHYNICEQYRTRPVKTLISVGRSESTLLVNITRAVFIAHSIPLYSIIQHAPQSQHNLCEDSAISNTLVPNLNTFH